MILSWHNFESGAQATKSSRVLGDSISVQEFRSYLGWTPQEESILK